MGPRKADASGQEPHFPHEIFRVLQCREHAAFAEIRRKAHRGADAVRPCNRHSVVGARNGGGDLVLHGLGSALQVSRHEVARFNLAPNIRLENRKLLGAGRHPFNPAVGNGGANMPAPPLHFFRGDPRLRVVRHGGLYRFAAKARIRLTTSTPPGTSNMSAISSGVQSSAFPRMQLSTITREFLTTHAPEHLPGTLSTSGHWVQSIMVLAREKNSSS